MKKIMKLFVLVAAAAMALASCQKNEIDGPVKKEVHFTIKAGISDTKTTITDNGDGTYTPSWTVGDMIGVMFELGDGENKDTEFTAKTVENGVATFEGKYTFATNDEGSVDGQLYAFYPSAAFNKSYSDGEVRLDLKAVQKPTSSSFDPSCDLLIAKPCDYIAEATGDQTEVVIDNMYFARMMSVLRINLKSEFLSNETVKSVSFNAEGMHLTGAMRFNLAEGTFKGNQTTSGNSEVKAEYSDDPVAVAGEKNSVYLVVAPVTIPSGTTLTFTIETENYDIVKTVTAPSEKVLPVGNVAVINLNIAEENCTAKTEDTSDYSGTYAILAKRTTGGYWYMTNDLGTASTKRFTAEEAGEALPEEGVTLGASKLWQVSKSGEYYTVKSVGANQYITWPSGNSADLGGVGIEFTIEKKEDGTYNLSYAASDETRYLSLNGTTGNNYFALYKSGQKADLSLIPAVQGEEPATLTATAPSQMSAEGGNGSFTYELKNPKDGVQLNATTEAAWITSVTVGDGEVTYTVTANESEEAREAVITLTYGDLTEAVTITQAGKPAEGGETETVEWVATSFADLKSSDQVVIVSTTDTGASYAMTNDNGTSKAPTAQTITYSNNKLTSEPAETIVWTVSVDGTNYIFHPNGDTAKWLYCTNTNNGVRVGNNNDKNFVLDSSTGYLKHTGTNRYLGVYNNQDWRCYTNTTGNTAGQTFQFFVKKGGSSEGSGETPEPEPDPTPDPDQPGQGGGDESQEATWHAETWTNCTAGKDTYGSATFVGDLGSWSYTGCSAYDATQFNTKKSLALGKTADNSSITSPKFDNGIKGIKFNYYANDAARKVVVEIYENGAVVKTETIKPSAKNTLLSAEISVETSGATYFIFTPGSASRRVSVGDIQVKY